MKGRFTTLDLIAIIPEIQAKVTGMRVNNVYDIDNKTFILRFSKQTGNAGDKETDDDAGKLQLIIQSGIRVHLSDYSWPKKTTPSGFAMKLRKHLRNKRLESMNQIGIDRIVDMQFGTGDFTNHVIVELFSKGNIILTDKDYNILSLVRFFKDDRTNINIAVREKYPINNKLYISKKVKMTQEQICEIIKTSKESGFKKIFNPHFSYGPVLLEHSVRQLGLEVDPNKWNVTSEDAPLIERVFEFAEQFVETARTVESPGYILKRIEKASNPLAEGDREYFEDFIPYLFTQFENALVDKFEGFNKAVDVFFSQIEGQKIDSKIAQNEKQAFKRLDAIKQDHDKRITALIEQQKINDYKAKLIEHNAYIVEGATAVLRSMLAQKLSWPQIQELVNEAQDAKDPIASRIGALKLDKGLFSMWLDNAEGGLEKTSVDIDVALSAYSNARKYYGDRKDAAKKEQKTIDVSEKALKNVERKVKQQLKETQIKSNIVLSRKVFWFEKFIWFISSEKYLVIAGRDAQQNELIVKRHLGKDDIYVHAEIHGASSVVIKNYSGGEIPPKTLNEAANFAVCYSASWENKVVCNAYWVYAHQVQKTAPTGQFLSVGSFMIRGKKNFIPQQNLILGFGFLYRIDEESYEEREKENKQLEDTRSDETSATVTKAVSSLTVESDSEEASAYPDTVVNVNPLASKTDDNYSIVNTGVIKTKVYTQADVLKSKKQFEHKQKKEKQEATEDAAKNEVKAPTIAAQGKKAATSNVPAPKKRGKKKYRVRKDQIWESDSEAETVPDVPQPLSQCNENATEQTSSPDDAESNEDVEENETTNTENVQEEHKVEIEEKAATDNDEEDEEEEEEEGEEGPNQRIQDAKRMIGSLVSNPKSTENLLFAIPVCAPYSTMSSYKFKVKIIPGTTKRGKASKNALEAFIRDKSATERERDLLKACKDLDIAKNLPGKIKMVALQNK